jgi:putative serine protease PepD
LLLACALLALPLGVVGGLLGARLADDQDRSGPASPVLVAPQPTGADTGSPSSAGAGTLATIDAGAIAAKVGPSVVTVVALVDGVEAGLGSGVIITADGEIITNEHVVRDADEVRVRLMGETEPRRATVLAADPPNDLALLQIEGSDFVPAVIADPAAIAVGDPVVAIGFALGLDGAATVSTGVVSGLERSLLTEEGALGGLVQTDAPISSGNSGGPLVNARGEVVGINTAVATSNRAQSASNVGFAISASELLAEIDALRRQAAGETLVEGFLGVGIDDRRDGGSGAVITEVSPGSPAADAGIEAGDIVVAADGRSIAGLGGLVDRIRDTEPGGSLTLTILRDGDRIERTATVVERRDG